jgi:DNA-directed RNA polymerase beta subunit
MNPPDQASEVDRRLMGVNGLIPFQTNNSSPRNQMFSSHIGQSLVIDQPTERYIQTGMEREFGKYTFSVKMPVDAEILKVIELYPRTIAMGGIAHNPETMVIYEDWNTKQVGYISLTDYFSHHPYFGFRYKLTKAIEKLRVGSFIKKGEILLDSPSVTDHGGYMFGRQCNVVYMSHPAVSEDGIVVSRDLMDKLKFRIYETRVIEWGSKQFPLNMYGDENNYKPFPEVGDKIRDDGLLGALRSFEQNLSPVQMSKISTLATSLSPVFDNATYVDGKGGTIIDIRVQHDTESVVPSTPIGMEKQVEKYDMHRRQYYQQIYDEYRRLLRLRGQSLSLSPAFHRMVVEAISVVGPASATRNAQVRQPGDAGPARISKLYRAIPLDDWRMEFVIEYVITPDIGFKLTDTHGGKGVICHVAEPHEMPVDEDGNRADIIMDAGATVSRMNLGRLYEQYINAASRDVVKRMRSMIGLTDKDDIGLFTMHLANNSPEVFETAWQYLMGYYEIASPRMHKWFTGDEYKGTQQSHLQSVLSEGIFLYIPSESEREPKKLLKMLQEKYPPTYGPVDYIGYSGKKIRTRAPARIGSVYILLLEKTGDDWSAVSSGKLQNFGVLSQLTNQDKYRQPTRNQAIRALGETEIRIIISYMGSQYAAELLDRNNNIATHRQVVDSILRAPNPVRIKNAVNRKEIPLGSARPLQLVKHLGMCAGWSYVYAPYVAPPPGDPLPPVEEAIPEVVHDGAVGYTPRSNRPKVSKDLEVDDDAVVEDDDAGVSAVLDDV